MTNILLITFNRKEFTKKTIESILERTKCEYQLIVVDNNSTDGSKKYLKKLKFAGKIDALILNKENLGLERALNIGFQIAKTTPYFITVDNDCIAPDLSPCWLTQMIDLMELRSEFAAISLRPQVLIGVGEIFNNNEYPDVVSNNVCGGSYRIMRTDAVKKVSGWTDKFEKDGRGNEEHDVCGKLRAAGHKVGYAKNLWTYHLFGKEGTWGYDKNSNYKMGRVLERSPEDEKCNPKTCEPHLKHNE